MKPKCNGPLCAVSQEKFEPVVFETVVAPHRSLPGAGFLIVMVALIGVSVAIGAGFTLAGAWPVIGFLGIDIFLIYIAFRISYKSAQRAEHVRVTDHSLQVIFLDGSGRVRRTIFQTYWARVQLEPITGGRKRLLIRSHGKTLEVGAFLGPDQKEELAESLAEAVRGVQEAAL